jgi:protein-S-isoprenylcysteine O-methyltransferase Ste14
MRFTFDDKVTVILGVVLVGCGVIQPSAFRGFPVYSWVNWVLLLFGCVLIVSIVWKHMKR